MQWQNNKVILIILYAIFNLFVFFIYGIDKRRAIKQKFRISENTLVLFSFFGPFGAALGMSFFHHKTHKVKFRFLVPFFMIIHIVFLLCYLYFIQIKK